MTSNNIGKIRCGKIQRGIEHPSISGYRKINVSTVSGTKEWKGLSPMLLGPFNVIEPLAFETYFPGGVHPGFSKLDDKTQIITVKKFENYWQVSKIYELDLIKNKETGINIVKKEFFDRRAEMFNLDKGKRRALPKKKAGVPISSYYQGQIMSYIESRKKIYCPYYESLVIRTQEYTNLYKLVHSGQDVFIVGPDGRDIEINEKSLIEAVNDPKYIFGHELVLCCLLLNIKPWLSQVIF